MAPRSINFPVFDADNHMYETTDAFTKFLPPEYKKLIQYVQVGKRTKIAVNGRVSEYIPNPTFEVVAAPGAQEEYFKGNVEGKSRTESLGAPIRSPEAFFSPEPRLKLMDELGIQGCVMWPTLASLLEERLRDDPRATHVAVHALNQWMYEHWSFNYQDRIFPAPVITLPIVEKAIEELEWVVERGARIILIRPAPVPGFEGERSMALPEFDPFWQKVVEADITVGLHASDDGFARYTNRWEGIHTREFLPFKDMTPFTTILMHQSRGIFDMSASLIGHGLCTRFPQLRFAPVENGSGWVRPLIDALQSAYATSPQIFEEDPVEVFKRNVWVHPFHEEDPKGLVELLGADRVLFGSDFPHPEGLADPVSYVDEIAGLGHDDIVKIMGGNLARLLKVAAPVGA